MLSLCEDQWTEFYIIFLVLFNIRVVVQSLCHVRLFVTPWTAACQASLSFTTLGLAQTHVHWVSDTIQPSRPLSSLSPPAFCLFQYQCLFQWLGPLHQVTIKYGVSASASVLPMNIQDWFPLELTGLISWLSKSLSNVFFSTSVWKHQFFGAQPSFMVQLSHSYMTTGPRGMVWGGTREEGSGWGTHVCLWRIHFDIWQN